VQSHIKKFRRFNRRRGVKFPNRPIGRLKVQICLFDSDTASTISSVKIVQLALNYFDRHSNDTVVTVYSSIVKIRYYSSKFNIVYWFPRLYDLYTGGVHPESNFVVSSLKYVTSGSNNFNYFTDKELTKSRFLSPPFPS